MDPNARLRSRTKLKKHSFTAGAYRKYETKTPNWEIKGETQNTGLNSMWGG